MTALDDVIEVLRRGQVSELVLHVDALSQGLSEQQLWVGDEPLQLASSPDDLAAIGVSDGARQLPADVALVRAAIGQDAGVTFAENGSVDLVDGIGAVLRWSDGSTPSESVPTQSADQARLRTVVCRTLPDVRARWASATGARTSSASGRGGRGDQLGVARRRPRRRRPSTRSRVPVTRPADADVVQGDLDAGAQTRRARRA